jgi:hypothetical protein
MNPTSICNQALIRIGEPRITSLTELTTPARSCNEFYEPTRDEVLSGHDWNFARKRAELSEISDAPLFGWEHQFQLPSDCLRVRQLNAFQEDEARPSWEVESGRLLTDEDTAQIIYTFRQTDTTLYSPLFIDALSLKLAIKLCTLLTGSRNQAADLVKEYEALVKPEAARNDSRESRAKIKLPWAESRFVQSRQAGVDITIAE